MSVSIFMYHQVGEFAPMRTHRATYCDHRNFRKQMALLHRLRYRVLRLSDAVEDLAKGVLPKRAVVLTFDDGYQNFQRYAAPELARYGFPSTVFLLSGMIGGRAEWLKADGHDAADLLDAKAIRELQDAGVEFGSHGRTHRRLSTLDPVALRTEIAASKTELESLLGRSVRSFCYPYGDYTPAAVEIAREAGYDAGLTCIRGRARPSDAAFELPRMGVSFGVTLPGYLWKLHFQKR